MPSSNPQSIQASNASKNSEVSQSVITKLQNRIDNLLKQPYTDADCKRYAKRLRRERLQLLTFLKYDDATYHNNTSERGLRLFALMRKVTYGSRSIRGIKTTETLMTAYATCKMRGINPYTFMSDYLNGDTDSIPCLSSTKRVKRRQLPR